LAGVLAGFATLPCSALAYWPLKVPHTNTSWRTLENSEPASQRFLAWCARCPGVLGWCACRLCYQNCCALALRCPRIHESNCLQLPTKLGNGRACRSYLILQASRQQKKAFAQCRYHIRLSAGNKAFRCQGLHCVSACSLRPNFRAGCAKIACTCKHHDSSASL
jgi:hypothetical protein